LAVYFAAWDREKPTIFFWVETVARSPGDVARLEGYPAILKRRSAFSAVWENVIDHSVIK